MKRRISGAVCGNVVYIPARGFVALDAADGKILWKEDCSRQISCSPAVAHDLVFFGYNHLYAYRGNSSPLRHLPLRNIGGRYGEKHRCQGRKQGVKLRWRKTQAPSKGDGNQERVLQMKLVAQGAQHVFLFDFAGEEKVIRKFAGILIGDGDTR